MPPRYKRRATAGSSDEDGPAEVTPPPRDVFHVVERPYYRPLGLEVGDRLVCTGGWQYDRLKGQRLEFVVHIWNLNVGRQYLRCWWARGGQWVSLQPDQVRRL